MARDGNVPLAFSNGQHLRRTRRANDSNASTAIRDEDILVVVHPLPREHVTCDHNSCMLTIELPLLELERLRRAGHPGAIAREAQANRVAPKIRAVSRDVDLCTVEALFIDTEQADP